MTVIQSEVRITGQDAGASAMIDRIGKKLDAMGKAARISPEVDKLASSLGRAEAQLRAIDKLNSAKTLSDLSKKKADEARRKVADIKTAMEGVEAPTRRMVTTLEKAEAAEARYIAQARRRATAVLEAGSALNKLGVSARQAGTAEAALKSEIDATTAALEKQMLVERQQAAASAARAKQAAATQRGKRGGHGDGTFAGLAGMYIGHEVGHFAHNVVERYGEFDRERRYAKVVMGLSDDEQEPLIRQAIHGGSTSRFNDVQWLESQRELAARGYNRDQVMAFAPIAAQIGQAFDKTMPDGVKALEGALLGFKKDTSTYEAAMASAQRTADLQVKASKISGMGYDDVVATYKYAAAPAQMAHLSEEQMLAFAAISKKANMGGDESGVAFRALAKNLLTPTAGAQIAMRASGINFNAFQRMPDRLDTGGFVDMVAKNFGVKLDDKARGALDGIFSNKALVNDATAFMPAVREALSQVLGGDDAKSKGKIAGLARQYRDASVQGIDTDGLMTAMMTAMSKNPALANAIFGSKQGGRIFAALGDPAFYAHILGELQHESQGFAGKVSDARMEGFSAAVQKLQGSIANVETAIGRSLDNGGKGGLLTDGTNAISGLLNAFTEATPQVHQLAAAGGAAAAAWGAIKGFNLLSGGFGLNASATHLDEAAIELKSAAASIGGKGAPGSGGPGGSAGGVPAEPGANVDKTGKATPFRNMGGRIIGNVLANAPVLMSAYDDIAHPDGRQERYEKQAEGAAAGRAAFGDVVRAARDRLGLGRLLRFSDDAKVMADDEQGPRLPPALVEEDALRRALRRIRITSDTPSDPWLGGERQAIEYRAIRSADAFRRDPEGARGLAVMNMGQAQAAPAPQGPIDVTGKVQAEVTSKVETQSTVKVEVTAAPGIQARQTFQSTTTRTSTGPSMPNAGVAPHVARRDE